MTLLLSAVTPEAIVVGADSALTISSDDDELALVGFPKIIKVPGFSMGIAVAGSAEVTSNGETRWISTWLKEFTEQAVADSFEAFCDSLVAELGALPNAGGINVLQCATWVAEGGSDDSPHMAPRLAEISNESGEFRWRSMLTDELVSDVLAWREGDKSKGYPVTFVSSGIPHGFADWVVRSGGPAFTQLVGKHVPDPQISAVAEYVRFLIRMVAELHRVARLEAYVGEPVETLLLFPTGMNMFSTRY